MFPGAHARVYYNDAGEPLGWDYPPDDEGDFDLDDYYDRDRDDRDDAEGDEGTDEPEGDEGERTAVVSGRPLPCGHRVVRLDDDALWRCAECAP